MPSSIGPNGHPSGNLQIETGQVATVLDANGNVLVTFPTAFVLAVTCVACNADWTKPHVATVTGLTLTNFTLNVKLLSTGANAASAACAVNWIAIGRR